LLRAWVTEAFAYVVMLGPARDLQKRRVGETIEEDNVCGPKDFEPADRDEPRVPGPGADEPYLSERHGRQPTASSSLRLRGGGFSSIT
jgi:hypothetical protein